MFGPGGDEFSDSGELYAINVDPDHWGTGVGTALLGAAIERLAAFGFMRAILWVHPGNQRARAFYEREGWEADGVDRDQEVLGVMVPETRYSRQLN
jgi:GNAT superfamily N-acetyltransferase